MSEAAAELLTPEEPWRAAVRQAVATFDYGHTIPRRWFLDAFDIEFPEVGTPKEIERLNLRLFAAMSMFREEMLTRHKMALKSIGHGDYLIVQPGEQHEFAIEQLCSDVDRAVRKSTRVVDHTDTARLSPDELRARNDALGKIAAFQAMANRSLGGAAAPKLQGGET